MKIPPEAGGRKSRRRLVAVAVLVFLAAIMLCGLWISRTSPSLSRSAPAPIEQSPPAAAPGAASRETGVKATPSAADEPKKAHAEMSVYPSLYAPYLNTICRSLSAEEQARVEAECQGDPRILAGLVMIGARNPRRLLEEALRQAPDHPLVHFAVLRQGDPSFDRLKSALALSVAAPTDAEPLYAAAEEMLTRGDRAEMLAYLKKAAPLDDYATVYQAALQAQIDAYRLAGRSENDARIRTYLENSDTIGDVALVKLELNSGLVYGPNVLLAGNEEFAALLLAGRQKGIYAKNSSLKSYSGSRGMELNYLTAFLRDAVGGDNPAAAQQYLTEPASKMLAAAKSESDKLGQVLYFSQDKAGVYQRLSPTEKPEFIQRIQQDGEVAAYLWAQEVRRDIFWSADFKPQGFARSNWLNLIGQ